MLKINFNIFILNKTTVRRVSMLNTQFSVYGYHPQQKKPGLLEKMVGVRSGVGKV